MIQKELVINETSHSLMEERHVSMCAFASGLPQGSALRISWLCSEPCPGEDCNRLETSPPTPREFKWITVSQCVTYLVAAPECSSWQNVQTVHLLPILVLYCSSCATNGFCCLLLLRNHRNSFFQGCGTLGQVEGLQGQRWAASKPLG